MLRNQLAFLAIVLAFVLLQSPAAGAVQAARSDDSAPATQPAAASVAPAQPDLAQPDLAQPDLAQPAPVRPRHMVIVSIDGLRPDVALLAEMPNLRRLVHEGSYSFFARTTDVAITLPSHTTMLTGLLVERHGITLNNDEVIKQNIKVQVPTLFEVARQAGLRTALVAGKVKFAALVKPGTLDWAWTPVSGSADDAEVARQAEMVIEQHKPNVLFVHFGNVDSAGHRHGWGSREQVAAIEKADAMLGRLLAALEQAGISRQTAVLVTADHGGSGKSHGRDDEASRYIPWIIAGPGIAVGQDLTRFRDLQINTQDTFATACLLLSLTPPPDIDGVPVRHILADRELLEAQ